MNLLFNVLRESVRKHQPDVIGCTYPIYPVILTAIITVEKRCIPIFTVVTDLAVVNKIWLIPAAE